MPAHFFCMFYSFFICLLTSSPPSLNAPSPFSISLPSTFLISSPHKSSMLWPVTLRFCSYLLGRDAFALLWQTPGEPHLVFQAITSKAEPWEGNEMREVREWERGGQRTFHPSLCRLPVGPPPPHSQTESGRADVESGAYPTQLEL